MDTAAVVARHAPIRQDWLALFASAEFRESYSTRQVRVLEESVRDVVTGRAELVIGARYTYNDRRERLQYLGIGPHVIRAGAGVRVRLN